MIIYKATNKINGKCYIGQTRHSLEVRKNSHIKNAKSGTETHFCQALRKYGEENFEWEILCHATNKKQLNELETFYIAKFDSIKHGYNMVDGGDNNIMDVAIVKAKHDAIMHSEEVRKKISDSMKKYRQEHPFTEEHSRRLSEKAMGNHNIRNCDSRSVPCRCIDEFGNEHCFHSYLEAGKWWYENYKPFPYSSCTYQRKIKQSIKLGYVVYRDLHKVDHKFDFPRWYEGGEHKFNDEIKDTK